MKFFIVLSISVLVLVQALEVPKERKEEILKIWKDCQEQSKVPTDLRLKAHQLIIEDDETVKDYIYCTANKLKIVSDKNELMTKEELLKNFSDIVEIEKINKVADLCLKKKDNPRETAYFFTKCSFQFRPLDNLPTPTK